MKRFRSTLPVVAILLWGLSTVAFSRGANAETRSADDHTHHENTLTGVAHYTCSMHPSVRSAIPGTCPICNMDLVPVTQEDLASGSILVTETRRQIIGVKTGTVRNEEFDLLVRFPGQLVFDESYIYDTSLRFDGWIGEINADYEGKRIAEGEILFTVYSPELRSLQEEYLDILKRSRPDNNLLAAAKQRFRLWGLTQRQISWLEEQKQVQDYLPIFSTLEGVVIEKNIVAGSAFKKGERLLRMANPEKVWVEAWVYEKYSSLVKKGLNAEIFFSNVSGENMDGEVIQVDPFLNTDSRARRIRVALNNNNNALSAGMLAMVIVHINLGEKLSVPVDAVLVSGEKSIVFKDIGGGRLKPVSVNTGHASKGRVVIDSGLEEGDEIVTSGNFLIASESKLKSGINQW